MCLCLCGVCVCGVRCVCGVGVFRGVWACGVCVSVCEGGCI